MKTTDVKEELLNKISEKTKEDLNSHDIRALCQAWSIIAGQENLDKLREIAPFPIPLTENN